MKTSSNTTIKNQSPRNVSRPQAGTISAKCSLDDVRRKAFELSIEHRTYDDYIWLLAESELKFTKACSETGEKGDTIKTKLARIVDKVDEKEIRRLAETYAKAHPKMQDLHWYIAERQCALEGAKRASK